MEVLWEKNVLVFAKLKNVMIHGLEPYPSDFNKWFQYPLLTTSTLTFELLLHVDFSIFHVGYCICPWESG